MNEIEEKINDLKLSKIQKKIENLKSKILQWNDEYYNKNNPTVSDEKYDKTYDELLSLEKQFPQFLTSDSPTVVVGAATSTLFDKFEHKTPMLSLEKATTKEELLRFYNNIQKVTNQEKLEFSLEHKIDGLSISLHYSKGKLVKAVTRGDGKIGEDVTENILQISSIKKTIPYLDEIEIRGEVFIEKKWLPIINEKLRLEFEEKQNKKIEVWQNETNEYNNYLIELENWKKLNEKYEDDIKKYNINFKKTINDNNQNSLFGDFEDKPIVVKPVKPTKPKSVKSPKKIEKAIAFKKLSNIRNAAAGTLRQKNSSVVKDRNLSSLFYDIVNPLNHNIDKQENVILFIKKIGLRTQNDFKILDSIDKLFDEIALFKDEKEKLEYDADGLVIKFNNLKYWELLGTTSKFPKYAIAFKYPAKESISTVLDIKTTVGRTGKITYVADVQPVLINDTLISKVTLNNWNYIHSFRLNIGDKVKIIKSGEIIPKIIEVVQKNSDNIFDKVNNCPSCGTKLEYVKDNADQFCLNDSCQQKNINGLIYSSSRDALNIKSLGKKNIELFYQKGFIKDISDIFKLEKYRDEILKLEGFKEKKIMNIFQGINNAKNTKLFRVIYSLGIDEVGMKASIELSKLINKLEDLIDFNYDDFGKINSIGEVIVDSLKTYFSSPKNIEFIKKLSNILNTENNKPNK